MKDKRVVSVKLNYVESVNKKMLIEYFAKKFNEKYIGCKKKETV